MKIIDYLKTPKEDSNFNLLPDGVFILEQDGKIIDVNNKILEMYNTGRFNILGRYFSDFIENGTAILNTVVSEQKSKIVKAIIEDETNESTFFEINAVRNQDSNKIYVVARNATEKKKQEEEINEKYVSAQNIVNEKNSFLSAASGAVLSGLVSITGFSRALLDGIGGVLSEKQQKYLNIINTSSKDLTYDLEKLFTLFKLESNDFECENQAKAFDLISLIKSIERIYQKDLNDKKILFSLDYSNLSQRDCFLNSEIVEYILRCTMDIFLRFSTIGKCSLNIGHPPINFLKSRTFLANNSLESDKYVLFEAKITDLVFAQDELENIFDIYYQSLTKRPIGLRATLNLLKIYITGFKGDIWIYSKPNFGTMFTFVLPLKKPQ